MKHLYRIFASVCASTLLLASFFLVPLTSANNVVSSLSGYVFLLDAHANHNHQESHGGNELSSHIRLSDIDNRIWTLEADADTQEELLLNKDTFVTVTGEGGIASGESVFYVDEIIHSTVQSYAPANNGNATSGDVTYAFLMCQFSDSQSGAFDTNQYNQIFSDTYPGVNNYFDTISYDQVNVSIDTYGPYTLPYPLTYYSNPTNGFTGYNLFLQDCMDAADDSVNFLDYQGILTLPSESYDNDWAGLATLGTMYIFVDGEYNPYKVTWLQRSGIHQNVIAHEIGHNLTWFHSSGPYGLVYDSEWDLMSGGYFYDFDYGTTYGFIGTDTIAFHKEKVGWLPSSKIYEYDGFGTVDITLEAHSKDQNDWIAENYTSLRLPHGNLDSFYSADARFQEGYDQGIPSTGVVLHSLPSAFGSSTLIDTTVNGNPNDDGSYLAVGESYTNNEYNYSLEVLSVDTVEKSFEVRLSSSSPTVALAPLTEEYYTIGQNILLQTTATDNGTVDFLSIEIIPEFGLSQSVALDVNSTPFDYTWTPTERGNYTIRARAVDNEGNESFSAEQAVRVEDPLNYWTDWFLDNDAETDFPVVLQEHDSKLYQSYIGKDNRIYTRFSSSTDPYNMVWSEFFTSPDPFEFTDKAISMTSSNGTLYQTHVGGSNKIWTRSSLDGQTWTGWDRDEEDIFEFTSYPVYQSDVNGTLYQTHVGGSNKIWTRSSADGLEWSSWSRDESDIYEFTQYPVTITSAGTDIYQVHVGGSNKIWTRSSSDGQNWTQWSRGDDPLEDTRTTVSVVDFNGVLVQAHQGLSNQIFTRFSFDNGQNWTNWSDYENFVGTENPIGMTVYQDELWQSVNYDGLIIIRKFIGELE